MKRLLAPGFCLLWLIPSGLPAQEKPGDAYDGCAFLTQEEAEAVIGQKLQSEIPAPSG